MINFILGHKGGIGKSTISALLAEYLQDENKEIFCIDLDPENTSLHAFNSLEVLPIQIKDKETGDINKRNLDSLIGIISENKNKEIIIDTGSTTYTPLTSYFIENDFFELLEEEKIEHRIISIVSGGGNILQSISGMKRIGEIFPKTNLIVVNNQLQAKTKVEGKQLTETKAFLSLKDKVKGIVDISKKSDYITQDILDMRAKSLLFFDLKTSKDFDMMQRRRLIKYRDEIWKSFKKAGI